MLSNGQPPQNAPPTEQVADDEPDACCEQLVAEFGLRPSYEPAQMEAFKECWRLKGNRDRTDSRVN
ncbi:unnamed protein product [Tuber aestivum]|uniref:Uncharacterized protein n=1 Tax=Tuber aestivum TaxID=59557 RepID=A0A292PWM1_9PEZI|nr:unnamed protein product [Tuber aestivum]